MLVGDGGALVGMVAAFVGSVPGLAERLGMLPDQIVFAGEATDERGGHLDERPMTGAIVTPYDVRAVSPRRSYAAPGAPPFEQAPSSLRSTNMTR